MGIVLSLVYLPAKYFSSRREKKKDEEIALNYLDARPPNPHPSDPTHRSNHPSPQSRPQPAQQQWQEQDLLPLPPDQQRQRVEESTPTLGGSPAPPIRGAPIHGGSGKRLGIPGTMASDEDYMAFLAKANEDPKKGYATAATGAGTGKGKGVQLKAVDAGVAIPRALRAATEQEEWIYVSDADEPFVAVGLRLPAGSTTLPDEEAFARLIHHPDAAHAQIDILDPAQWDSGGQYGAVVDATRTACGGGDVRVYRVALGGTRFEYWVVGVGGPEEKGGEKSLIGVKALAIES